MDLPVAYSKLSPQQRREVREEYVRKQGGKCCHCGANLKQLPSSDMRNYKITWSLFPPNFLRHPVHLHHNHETDMTIGAVHALCNAVLWEYFGE